MEEFAKEKLAKRAEGEILATCIWSWIIMTVSVLANLNMDGNSLVNSSDTDKDVYVINAMVYQIGIVTNKSDENITTPINLGNQEALTLFRNNGSTFNLSSIDPLLTNVTAQQMVGVAPVDPANGPVSWSSFNQFAPIPTHSGKSVSDIRFVRDTYDDEDQSDDETTEEYDNSGDAFFEKIFKRSSPIIQKEVPVKIVQGSGAIPQEAGLQSLAIPPLLTLSNNFSEIPVPIPNTSVVHYTKRRHHDAMSSPKLNDRCSSSMSNGKKYLSHDCRDDSLDNSISVKSERSSKCEEDWRKRTIIVENKNGTFGFTLQSYGIHYKKEHEIEVITYVDHVEPDGPAAAAGMREGDVILNINGRDVEHADHSTLVQVIAASDSRMRMVVLFEDCVRKVELHLKYIKLQRALQAKLRELDQLNIRERHLFDNNWKTHSLPSQKKKSSPSDVISDNEDNVAGEASSGNYCRPTLSSENFTSAKPHEPSVFMYQYLDPRYGSCVIQPNIHTGGFVITVGSPRNRRDCHHYVVKSSAEHHRPVDAYKPSDGKINKSHRNSHSHGCGPCMPVYNNQDANSLDAYDLASPCCDPHCVPHTRKKSRRKKECSKEHKRKEKCQQVDKSTSTPKSDNSSHSRSKKVGPSGHCSSRYRNLSTDSTQTSQCSLQSYATNATGPCDNTASSYTTSLSTDTLFWDNERSEVKSSPKIQYQSTHHHAKPKSWDNLTTKAVGGYGFGYGYLDTTEKQASRSKSHGRNHGERTYSHHEYQHHTSDKHSHRQSATPHHYAMYGRSHSHCVPTKSTESLIVVPKFQLEMSGSESRLTCDCGETVEYYRRLNAAKSPSEIHSSGYYTPHFIYPTNSRKKKDSNVSSEMTRL